MADDNFLPRIKKLEDADYECYVYYKDNDGSYNEFLKHVTKIISSDARAFVVNDEIFWNSYPEKSYLQTINEDIVRSHLIENPHSLFCQINRSEENVDIQICMFPHKTYNFPFDCAWIIEVTYNAPDHTYRLRVPKEYA